MSTPAPLWKVFELFKYVKPTFSNFRDEHRVGCIWGDPDDRSLRKVEVEVVIPKLMREKAKTEKCVEEVGEFNKCCKASSLLMVVKCRDENSALKSCLTKWYENNEFKQICTEQYLNERSEYRRSGIKKPMKRA